MGGEEKVLGAGLLIRKPDRGIGAGLAEVFRGQRGEGVGEEGSILDAPGVHTFIPSLLEDYSS